MSDFIKIGIGEKWGKIDRVITLLIHSIAFYSQVVISIVTWISGDVQIRADDFERPGRFEVFIFQRGYSLRRDGGLILIGHDGRMFVRGVKDVNGRKVEMDNGWRIAG